MYPLCRKYAEIYRFCLVLWLFLLYDYAAKGLLRHLAKSTFVKTSVDRRYSAFLLRFGPLCRCPMRLGIHSILRICVATVTILVRFSSKIYLLSDPGGPHPPRTIPKLKPGHARFKFYLMRLGFTRYFVSAWQP